MTVAAARIRLGIALGLLLAPATSVHALRSFQCYRAKTSSPSVPPMVTLADAFVSGAVAVGRTEAVCAPADENGQDPGAPADPEHLLGYRIRQAFTPVRDVRVDDRFGAAYVDLMAVDALLVPSLVTPGTPPSLGTFSVDHFRCYRVRSSRGRPPYASVSAVVTDEVGSATVTIGRPTALCLPADKNGEDPAAVGHIDLLLCHHVTRVPVPKPQLGVRNQFVLTQIQRSGRDDLCIPALRPPVTTTSTTTTTTTSTSSSTSVTTGAPVCGNGVLEAGETCDPRGMRGICLAGTVCDVSCSACAACPTPVAVVPAAGGALGGHLQCFPSSVAGSCSPASALPSENLFTWTPAVSGVATIDTCGTSSAPNALYLRDGDCSAAELACADANCPGGARITPTVTAGRTYTIVVDVGGGGFPCFGDFTVTVTPATSTTTTTATSTTSTTLPPGQTCCQDFYSYLVQQTVACGNASSLTVSQCTGLGGTPVGSGDAVCDATGSCGSPPGMPGGCCQAGDACALVDSLTCVFGAFGTFHPAAVCTPSGACVP